MVAVIAATLSGVAGDIDGLSIRTVMLAIMAPRKARKLDSTVLA
jgi:hypothetical protein